MMINNDGYILGVDPYREDKFIGTAVVMKKVDNTNINLVTIYQSRVAPDFEKEVKRLSEFYNVKPEICF